MSDFSELVIGIALLLVSVAALIVCLPRKGKTVWFVGIPLLAPAISILMISGIASGLILIAAYFTTIDNITMSG